MAMLDHIILKVNDPNQHLIEIRTYEPEHEANDQDPRS